MPSAHAGEFAYGIGYVGEYSDNIRRVPANLESEKVSSTLMGVAYRESAPTFDAFLQAQAQYNHYRNDTYSDGPIYYADSSLFWRILPQQLTWFFIDRYDQVVGDPLRPNTPDNRIGTNVFYTGPDLLMRLGQVNTLVLGLRYGNTAYSDALPGGIDPRHNRYGSVARWQYAADAETTYSLNYEIEELKYDDEIRYGNLSRQDIFVQLNKRLAYTRFLLDLGATRLDRDLAGVSTPESTGHLARLTWTRQIASGTLAGVRLASEYLNAGAALLSTATSPTPPDGGPPATLVAGELTSDYFYSKRAEAYYTLGDGKLDLNTRINFSDIDYEIAPLDRKESGGRLDVTYKLSGLLSTTLYGSHLNVQYLSPLTSRDDRNNEIGLKLSYRINMKLSATLDGRKSWRYSTIAAQEYTDRRLLFSLVYASSPLFAPTRR